jgi:hypothetical protein
MVFLNTYHYLILINFFMSSYHFNNLNATNINGNVLATGTLSARSLQNRFADVINVKDFGAVGNGVTDDTAAFQAAINVNTGIINVPKGTYLLNSNITPSTINKSIFWNISPEAIFIGAGTGFDKFPQALTNVGNTINGPWCITYPALQTISNGAINAFTIETSQPSGAGFPIIFTGNLTNGSNVITSVSNTTGLSAFLPILVSVSGFLSGFGSNLTRIVSSTSNTVTTTHAFSGVTTTGATISALFWGQHVALYTGARTSNPSKEANIWALNPMVEALTGAGGTVYGTEIDVVTYSQEAICKGLLVSGHGNVDPDVAIEVARNQEFGANKWFYGVDVQDSHFGLRIKSDNTAITVDTSDGVTKGINFTNVTNNQVNSVFAAKQLFNNANTLVLQRNTDTAPTGTFLRFLNASDTLSLFTVDVSGNLVTAGKVGVNTYQPNEQLTVVGNISATGRVYSNNRVDIVSTSTNVTFTNDDSGKIYHFDTTSQSLCAIFPTTNLADGFNVTVVNTGTQNVLISSNNLKSIGTTISEQYGSAYVYEYQNSTFATGRLI